MFVSVQRHDVYERDLGGSVALKIMTFCVKAYDMSPEHEKLLSLLCVFHRVAQRARGHDPVTLHRTVTHIHVLARDTLYHCGPQPKVSLRVRIAMEEIIACTMGPDDNDRALARVERAANWGSGKSKLLTSVTDNTWLEQCAGRAQLALRRDYPELMDF